MKDCQFSSAFPHSPMKIPALYSFKTRAMSPMSVAGAGLPKASLQQRYRQTFERRASLRDQRMPPFSRIQPSETRTGGTQKAAKLCVAPFFQASGSGAAGRVGLTSSGKISRRSCRVQTGLGNAMRAVRSPQPRSMPSGSIPVACHGPSGLPAIAVASRASAS
jgi:hypothetical protein